MRQGGDAGPDPQGAGRIAGFGEGPWGEIKEETMEKTLEEIRDEVDNLLFKYWEALSEPKKDYVQWWYGDGGIKDALDNFHPDPVPVKTPAVKVEFCGETINLG